MQSSQVQKQSSNAHLTEEILVIPRSALFQTIWPWYGIQHAVFDKFMNIIQENTTFMPRSHAETNPTYKQIIPYMIFMYNKKIFVMQRKSTASEQRLASKFSIGIGGHIRQEDMTHNNIMTWAMREFNEEVTYSGSMHVTKLGILNDDTSDVGKVHLGLILLIQGSNNTISIKDEHKSGILLTLDECKTVYDQMENWSKICFDFIIQNQNIVQF